MSREDDAAIARLFEALHGPEPEDQPERDEPEQAKKKVVVSMREDYDALIDEVHALRDELGAAEEELAGLQQTETELAFAMAGLTEAAQDLYREVNGDAPATLESVQAFQNEYQLEGAVVVEPERVLETPTTTPTMISGADVPRPRRYSAEEIRKIGMKDEARALQIIAEQSEPDPNNPGELRLRVPGDD